MSLPFIPNWHQHSMQNCKRKGLRNYGKPKTKTGHDGAAQVFNICWQLRHKDFSNNADLEPASGEGLEGSGMFRAWCFGCEALGFEI